MVINPKTGKEVTISSYINQAAATLTGYLAIYEDGSKSVFKYYSDIEAGTISNPIVDIQQVGCIKENHFLVRRGFDNEERFFSLNQIDELIDWANSPR